MNGLCTNPLGLEDLLAYRFGELEGASLEALEAHYFACENCTDRLVKIFNLGKQIAILVRRGAVSAAVTDEFVATVQSEGLTLRTYSLSPGDSVACTAAPDDDFVVVRLLFPLQLGEVVDLHSQVIFADAEKSETQITRSVFADHQTSQVVFVFAASEIRSIAKSQWSMKAHVTSGNAERTVGPFIMNHTPWEELNRG